MRKRAPYSRQPDTLPIKPNSMHDDPIQLISTLPPQFSCAEARAIAWRSYGFEVTATPLVSERDQNFHLAATDGSNWVLKIANADEEARVTDLQIKALQHLAEVDGALPVPRVQTTVDGADRLVLEKDTRSHTLRLVSWLSGDLLNPSRLTPALCSNLGMFLARLGQALAHFEHPGGAQRILWDLREALALRELLPKVGDPELRGMLAGCLDDFAAHAKPRLADMRSQVIHNDFNPDNVLVDPLHPETVVGVIDFGDLQRAPLVMDVAVAAAYLRNRDGDPLTHIADFVAGYHALTPLTLAEIDMLYDLVCTRLATTLVILAWRSDARGAGDAYLEKAAAGEGSAAPFLRRLRELPRAAVARRLRQVCASVNESRD